MIICDRCKSSQKNMRQCRMGMWYEKIIQGHYGDFWAEKRGDQHEMTLCPSCFDELSKKIVSTIEQDQIQPAYSLPPRRSSMVWFWWVLVVACGFINLVCYVLNLYERNHH